MNNVITPNNHFSPLSPGIEALVLARGGTLSNRYELEDTVLRAGGYAWDIASEAAPLHAQIAAITQAEAAAEVARQQDLINNPPPVPPWRVSRDTIWQRLKAAVGTPTAHAVLAGFTTEQRNEWFSNDYFNSDNADVRNLATELNLDADMLLAPDPYFNQ